MSNYKKWLVIFAVALPLLFLLSELLNSFSRIERLALQPDGFSTEIRYAYLEDKTSEITLQHLASKSVGFVETEFNQAKVDFGTQTYWYQLDIRNVRNHSRQLVLLFDNPMLDTIEVFNGRDLSRMVTLGDAKRPEFSVDIAFPHISLELDPGQTEILWIKTRTTGTPNLPLALFNKQDFSRYKDAVYILWGCFIGIIVLMSVYNLILYTGVKESLYLLYVGYVGCFLLVLGVVHGFLIYLVPFEWFSLISENVIFWFYLLGYFMLAFALSFLKFYEEPNHIITKVGRTLLKVILVLAVASLFMVEYQAAQIFFVVQGLVYVLAVVMVASKLRANLSWAKFYIFSWLPLFVGAAVGPMMLTGNLEYNFWTRHALLLGVMFEMSFISMALAERLRMSENERLFEASHDHIFGFANTSLIEQKAREFISKKETHNFSIVVITIEKYESFVPYLSPENLKKLVFQFAGDAEEHLSSQLLLAEVDEDSRFSHSVMLREGVFAFLVSSNDDALLNRVLSDFEARQPLNYQLDELSINLSCIIGASANTERLSAPHELINQAQQAVDSALENNKRCWIYSRASKSEEGRNVKLASDLQAAIEQDQLQLFHQPQIALKTGQVVRSEVLLRWEHPILGFVSPEEFVTVAENTGLINKLSQWVFRASCQHMRTIKNTGLQQYRISVNFSAYDVMLENFVTSLVEKIDEFNLKADNFILELTETVSVTDTKRFDQNLVELKDLGFHIAIDDFGTGYSSLTYVSRHPFDELKIDRGFVIDLAGSEKHQSIVKATINMANSLGLTVVAEGIENERCLALLKQFGCGLGQGYLYARPMPFDQYLEWLDEFKIKVTG